MGIMTGTEKNPKHNGRCCRRDAGRDLHPVPTPSVQALPEGRKGKSVQRPVQVERAGPQSSTLLRLAQPSPPPPWRVCEVRPFSRLLLPAPRGLCLLHLCAAGRRLAVFCPAGRPRPKKLRGAEPGPGRGFRGPGAGPRRGAATPPSPRPQLSGGAWPGGGAGAGPGRILGGAGLELSEWTEEPGGVEVAGRGRREVSRTQAGRRTGRGYRLGIWGIQKGRGLPAQRRRRGMRAGWGRAEAGRGRGWQNKPGRRWVVYPFEVA